MQKYNCLTKQFSNYVPFLKLHFYRFVNIMTKKKKKTRNILT